MEIGKIVSSSLKYPFRNIKKLPILFILFILAAIVPIGLVSDNRYITILGVIAFFLFILIVPGYMFSMVNLGLNESAMFPSVSFGKDIYNTIRLLVLRIVYMLVPTAIFLIVLHAVGISSVDMLHDFNIHGFFLSLALILILVLIAYIVFEVLLFFAKARLAYLDSLTEALKMHKVVGDIKKIGVFNIVKWLIFMGILMVVASVVSSWVMMIPYVGFLVYIGIVIPILESIGNYSLGLLYSNIVDNDGNLDKFDKELQALKYLN
ncbi:MAG: DUF4013 domain-containing protein [Methanobrevibacter sp.]|nr:DUF4013 domain-containing protein [Methanobrevibacter sp.]